MPPLGRRIAFATFAALLPLAALALVEGTASLSFFVREVHRQRAAVEVYAERDTLLGWISKPNVDLPNMFGPGIGLRSNSQRFRHHGDLTARPKDGRLRAVCSGDSFTWGYGVSDQQTWCADLGRADPRLEMVNLGEGAYGVDQSYLRYLRDGLPLQPDLHLFAVISPDFQRLTQSHFSGYPKPLLKRDGDSLRVTRVPVPRPGFRPALVKLTFAVRTLRTFAVLDHFLGDTAEQIDRAPWDSASWDVAHLVFRDLARRDSAAGTALVIVYLPEPRDVRGTGSDNLRRWMREAALRNEFRYVDLVEPFRRLSPDSANGLFISSGRFFKAAGHYSVAGNAWVADQLRHLVPELTTVPSVALAPY